MRFAQAGGIMGRTGRIGEMGVSPALARWFVGWLGAGAWGKDHVCGYEGCNLTLYRRVCGHPGAKNRDYSVVTRFSARARKTAPEAGALPKAIFGTQIQCQVAPGYEGCVTSGLIMILFFIINGVYFKCEWVSRSWGTLFFAVNGLEMAETSKSKPKIQRKFDVQCSSEVHRVITFVALPTASRRYRRLAACATGRGRALQDTSREWGDVGGAWLMMFLWGKTLETRHLVSYADQIFGRKVGLRVGGDFNHGWRASAAHQDAVRQ
jgi:hypothetical protein